MNKFKYEYKLPVAFIEHQDRASRNIVGGRELLPVDLFYMDQFFILLSSIIMFSGFMTITSINPVHSVFWLVILFINNAILLMVLKFEFISFMLIIIYVGAIAILFLFIIMMIDILQLREMKDISHIVTPILIIITSAITQIWWVFELNNIKFFWSSLKSEWEFEFLNHIATLSYILYVDYGYPLIILGLLLLVAMVGAIVLTLELGSITRRQILSDQHQRNNSWI